MADYEICGHCRYHLPDAELFENNEFMCDCEESEYYTDFTGYNDSCNFWEERTLYIS